MNKLIPIIFTVFLMLSCNTDNKSKEEVRKNANNDKTIMAIFAHSDDERSISPILAKYAKEGVNVYLVLATDGSKGVTPHANIPAGDSLAKVRADEALCVTKTLGINPPILLNYTDGDLSLWDNIFSLDDKIDSLFTKYQPDVVMTWGPDGGYGHPDHRMVGNIVTEVFQREASDKMRQLLYVGFLKEAMDSAPKLNTDQANWFKENIKTTKMDFLTYRIPFEKEDLVLGREAFGCCKSQYIPEVMDELFVLIEESKGFIYFRPWNDSKDIRNDIFE